MTEVAVSMRIDKWLWAVRLYKSRSQASEACEQNKIILLDHPVKASRMLREGDEVRIKRTGLTMTIKVLQLTGLRLPAKLVSAYYADLTPVEEIENYKARILKVSTYRDPGTGRPTKKDRRMLDDFFSND